MNYRAHIMSSLERRTMAVTATAVALVASLGGHAAAAQELAQGTPSGPGTTEAASSTALDEVVVTARRREERLKDVPISAIALSGQSVAERNIVAMEELSRFTPNFRQTNGIVSPYRVLRGVSSGSNFSFDQAVGAFSDGLYVGRAQLGRMPFFDIERVEVLRGPQVILFGNSTTGGAISTTTRRPGSELAADLRATYEFENHETVLEGGVTLPLSDTFSVRLAGFSQVMTRGWVKSNFGGATRYGPNPNIQGGRVTAVYTPTDNLEVTLRYERNDIHIAGGTQQVVLNRLNNPLVAESSFDGVRVVGSPPPFGVSDQTGVRDDDIKMNPELWLGIISYQLGDFTLTSQTGYINFNFSQAVESDWTPASVAQINQGESYKQFSQEFRVSGEIGSALNIQAGAYYQRDVKDGFRRFDFNPRAAGTPLPAFGVRVATHQISKSYSGFVDAIYKVTPRLRLGLGARYTWVDRIADQSNHAVDVGTGALNPVFENTFIAPGRSVFSAIGGTAHDYLDIEDSEHHFQPQVLVQYDITPEVMGYAKFVRGAKSGGYDWSYQGASPRGGVFLPEKANAYEAGIKGSFLDRSLSIDVQLYRTDFKDLQVSAFDGVSTQIVRNAAAQRSQGVEIEANWRPVPELTLSASGAYLDAKYREYPGGACNFVQRAATPAGTVCVSDLSGTSPPFLSKWSGNLSAQYEAPVAGFLVTSRLELSYRSSYNGSTNNDPAGVQDGFATVDGRVQLSREDADWTIAVFGKNLTDKRVMEFFLDAPLITGVSSAVINRGRQVGVQVSKNF